MFNFFRDIDNYETRRIGKWVNEDATSMVSTACVSDGQQPYETAFQHPDYNDGEMVIVEAYDTKDQAIAGHERWLKIMQTDPLPDHLEDCANSEIASLLDGKMLHPRVQKN